MALFADGGIMGSKPYAASGAYIRRMSNYCGSCEFDSKTKTGPRACPFNYLYWNFIIENRDRLKNNPRMAVIYRTLERMDAESRRHITQQARDFLETLFLEGE
jgi:deoxyribodipyrimidine photolyase-related protein